MRRYRLLEQPLPPGLTTLRDYAQRTGYSPNYIRRSWGKRRGFPAPVGHLAAQAGRGGWGELVYAGKALDAFRARHKDLWGRRRAGLVVTRRDLDEPITPGEFARQLAGVGAGEMARYQDLEGFPETGADGTARLGDLVAYWNTRPVIPRYRLLERPLAPGLTTLRDYAQRIGYTYDYIMSRWRPRAGFPAPTGELPARAGRGGRGELVYDAKALDAFRALYADLWGRRPMLRVVTRRDLDEQITPRQFARQLARVSAGEMARYQDLEGFPESGPDGTARLGDLLAYWNTRPTLLPAGYSGNEQVTIAEAAEIIGFADPRTISQYDGHPGFPAVASGAGTRRRKYRLGNILEFLNSGRPGKRGRAAKAAT